MNWSIPYFPNKNLMHQKWKPDWSTATEKHTQAQLHSAGSHCCRCELSIEAIWWTACKIHYVKTAECVIKTSTTYTYWPTQHKILPPFHNTGSTETYSSYSYWSTTKWLTTILIWTENICTATEHQTDSLLPFHEKAILCTWQKP